MQKNNIKKILITGISSGIGKEIVRTLSKDPNLYIIGCSRKNIDIDFKNFEYHYLDLENQESCRNLANKLKNIDAIDVYINNASLGYKGTVEDLDLNFIRQQFEVNLFGPLAILKSIISSLEKNKGMIINIDALGSVIDTPTFGYYASSKLAFNKLLNILAMETNISFHNIYLGAVKSNFGRNIQSNIDIENSRYKNLYEEWQERFINFFKARNKAADVATLVEKLINGESNKSFISIRDHILFLSKIYLPQSLYKLVLFHFYKL
jgi:short-subunit dehydrogenase